MKRLFLLAVLSGSTLYSIAQEASDTTDLQRLNEVVVVGQNAAQRIKSTRLGTEKLEMGQLNRMPQFFGESDIIKSITLLPGVHSESDGSGGFEVRGGNANQNLVMLDGMSLYNPSHVMGIFSTFNTDAVSRASLYKGPIPASYGEAISSVLDVGLAQGDMEKYRGSATLGLLAAKVKVEGPIVKDKLSIAVSARRSYLDLFLKMTDDYKSTALNFWDVTAKVHYTPTQSDIIDFSFIAAHDNMAIKEIMGMNWGNVAGGLKWLHHCGDNLRFTTSASYTDYSPTMWMSLLETGQTMNEYIRNAHIGETADWIVSDSHNMQFGFRSELKEVETGEMKINLNILKEIRRGWQNAVWVTYDGEFSSRWAMESGVRFSFFEAMKSHEFHTTYERQPVFANKLYFDTEFRINLKYSINDRHNIKLGIGDVTQNLHALRSGNTTMPFDRYALTSATVKPERSFQLGLGYSGMTDTGNYDWSAELYHRDSKNIYDYKDGMTMFSDIDLESLILGGKGRSYGAELMVRKNAGPLSGWISYTISKTQTKIPGINNGQWYNASNDRRHDINIAAIYKFNPRWSASAAWTFSSGSPLTVPDVKYQLDGTTCYYSSQRNAYLTPDTHRLDISANYIKAGKKVTQELSFGFYNVYNRYNPYIIYFKDDDSKPSGTQAVQQSLYGLLPSIAYTLKF